MKLVNKTLWRSDDLKAILTVAARAVGVSTRGWTAIVAYSKTGRVVSYRYCGEAKYAQVSVPSPAKVFSSVIDEIAAVETGSAPASFVQMIYECAAASFSKSSVNTLDPCQEFLLRRKPKKVSTRETGAVLQRKKIEGLKTRLALWETKAKRAESAIKRINKEIRRRKRILSQLGESP